MGRDVKGLLARDPQVREEDLEVPGVWGLSRAD